MSRPALPEPTRSRWQPLRLGCVDLYYYDSEEFWFHDGRMLLRGNNGTGKSKVLSLTLPFLFDAQIKPSRIEPDGDPGKKMAWNLLMGKHDRRTGYTWAEFGRLGADGQAHYLTLGCGMSAVAARGQVDPWYFIADGLRIGESLWLTTPQGVVLSRERLNDALHGHGQVYPNADAYRRAVDERLFRLGAQRYNALMDTLIQLRQPQLSKRPDEANLSEALSEALPPLPSDLLGDVAEAMGQMDEYRHELAGYEAVARAVGDFNQRYRVYAGMGTRREAARLRAAQSEFDKASQALNEAHVRHQAALLARTLGEQRREETTSALRKAREALQVLQDDPALLDARRLDEAERNAGEHRRSAEAHAQQAEVAARRCSEEREALHSAELRAQEAGTALAMALAGSIRHAEASGISAAFLATATVFNDPAGLAALSADVWQATQRSLRDEAVRRREQIAAVRRLLTFVQDAAHERQRIQERRDGLAVAYQDAMQRQVLADEAVERVGGELFDAWQTHFAGLKELRPTTPDMALAALSEWVVSPEGENPARAALHVAQQSSSERRARRSVVLQGHQHRFDAERLALQDERSRLEEGENAAPPAFPCRAYETREGRAGAPFWQLLEFRAEVDAAARAGIESALEAAGLLDAWVSPEGRLIDHDGHPWSDAFLTPRPSCAGGSLADWLEPAESGVIGSAALRALLESIACSEVDSGQAEAWIAIDGRFRIGPLSGAWRKEAAHYVGHAARMAARVRRLAEIAGRLSAIERVDALLDIARQKLAERRRQADGEWQGAPGDQELRRAHAEGSAAAQASRAAERNLREADSQLAIAEQAWRSARERLFNLKTSVDRLPRRIDCWFQSAFVCVYGSPVW